jgi:hypothetical protein
LADRGALFQALETVAGRPRTAKSPFLHAKAIAAYGPHPLSYFVALDFADVAFTMRQAF